MPLPSNLLLWSLHQKTLSHKQQVSYCRLQQPSTTQAQPRQLAASVAFHATANSWQALSDRESTSVSITAAPTCNHIKTSKDHKNYMCLGGPHEVYILCTGSCVCQTVCSDLLHHLHNVIDWLLLRYLCSVTHPIGQNR